MCSFTRKLLNAKVYSDVFSFSKSCHFLMNQHRWLHSHFILRCDKFRMHAYVFAYYMRTYTHPHIIMSALRLEKKKKCLHCYNLEVRFQQCHEPVLHPLMCSCHLRYWCRNISSFLSSNWKIIFLFVKPEGLSSWSSF